MNIQTYWSSCVRVLGLLSFLAFSAAQGFSTTTIVAVGTCVSGVVQFTTIQSAVNQSPAGTVVKICPATYTEQVTVNKKITLQGVSSSAADQAIIVPPTGGLVQNASDFDNGNSPVAAQIVVESPATGVAISNLTVDAAGNSITGCATDVVGILFQNSSGTVNHVAVRNDALDPADNGCQSGLGINVQTASGSASTVTVENSSVHGYQKNGITGNDLGTTLTVTGNYVQGQGPTTGAAENGIQLGFGATGKISSNIVVDNIYSGPIYGASGILLYDTAENSGISVSGNTVGNAQLAIALATFEEYGPGEYGDGVTVSANKILGTMTFDAIDVCTNSDIVTNNVIMNSGQSGIHMDASCSNNGNTTGNNSTATGNTILEAGCAGILEDTGTSGDTVSPDTFYTVPNTTLNGTCPVLPSSLLHGGQNGSDLSGEGGRRSSPKR